MKKLFAAGLVACLTLSVGFTQGQPKPKPTPKEIACPVMPDHKVNIADATKTKMFADYKGRRYFFCCAGCVPAFKANPAKYAKGPSIPTPKPKKS